MTYWHRGVVDQQGYITIIRSEFKSPCFYFFVFEKRMFALLKTRVNGARYRSQEGSL